MRKLSVVVAIFLGASALAAFPVVSMAQTCTCPGIGIRAERAPPPLPVYDQPPVPAPGYIWTPGYWSWNNYDYYWVPGTWVEPPEPELLWTPGYWGYNEGIYVFNAGYWGRHVGFYGGVVYGFGYTGVGYEGGYWQNRQFFYNRTVNNISNTHITNIYNKTVINNTTINNISYNGGKGGITARPTPEDEIASKEQHVQPTALQVEHTRAASTNGALFVTANHGKPTIAATARPSAFKGAGVVPARAFSPQTEPPVGAGTPPNAGQGQPIKTIEGGKPLPTAPNVEPHLTPGAGSNTEPKLLKTAPLETRKPSVTFRQPVQHAAPFVQHRTPQIVNKPRPVQHAAAPARPRPQMVRHAAPPRPRPAARRVCGHGQRC